MDDKWESTGGLMADDELAREAVCVDCSCVDELTEGSMINGSVSGMLEELHSMATGLTW